MTDKTAGDRHLVAVEMTQIPAVVKRPVGTMLLDPEKYRSGSISIGAGHVPDVGGVMYVTVHDRDGTILVACLSGLLINQVAARISEVAVSLAAGQFDQPRVVQ